MKEKQAAIDRLQSGRGVAAQVSERELISDRKPAKEVCPPAPACPDQPAVACPPASRCEDHSAELSSLRSALSQSKSEAGQVKAQLSELRSVLEKERSARTEEVATYEAALQRLEGPSKSSAQQVAMLSRTLEETRRQVQNEAEQRQKLQRQYQAALDQKEAELEAKQVELQAKTNQLEARDTQMVSLKTRVAELQDAQAKAQLRAEAPAPSQVGGSFRAVQSESAPREAAPQYARSNPLPASSPARSLLSARERAVESLRSEVSGGLARLKSGIQTRDTLFARWDQRGRALQIRPQPLRTSAGETPDTLSQKAASASSVRELITLREQVRQLEARVNDDIAVARRMGTRR